MSTRTERDDRILAIEDFMAMPDEEGYRIELSGGRLVREPAPGPRHGNVAIRIASLLHRLGQQGGHGLAFVGTAFTLARDPATIRVGDLFDPGRDAQSAS